MQPLTHLETYNQDKISFFTAILQRDLEKTKKLLDGNKELLFATVDFGDIRNLSKLDMDGGLGMNALHIARRLSNLALMQLLLSYEGSEKLVNQTNLFGNRTPLFMNYHYHERLVPSHAKMLQLLLSKGADLYHRDCEGRTALYTVLNQPAGVQIMIDSVKTRTYEAFKRVMLSYLHNDTISIVFAYHTPFEIRDFLDNVGRPAKVSTPLGYLFSKFQGRKMEDLSKEELEVAKMLISCGADLQRDASDLQNVESVFSVICDWTAQKHPLAEYFKDVLSLEEIQKVEQDVVRKSKAVSAESGCCVVS